MDAKKYGIERFRMMPAVGDSPAFIACLKDLVLKAAGNAEESESNHRRKIEPSSYMRPERFRLSYSSDRHVVNGEFGDFIYRRISICGRLCQSSEAKPAQIAIRRPLTFLCRFRSKLVNSPQFH